MKKINYVSSEQSFSSDGSCCLRRKFWEVMQIWSNTWLSWTDPSFCYRLSDACVDCWLQMIPFLITASPWDCWDRQRRIVDGKPYAIVKDLHPVIRYASLQVWIFLTFGRLQIKVLVFFVNFPFSIWLFVYNINRNVIRVLVLFPSVLAMQAAVMLTRS